MGEDCRDTYAQSERLKDLQGVFKRNEVEYYRISQH